MFSDLPQAYFVISIYVSFDNQQIWYFIFIVGGTTTTKSSQRTNFVFFLFPLFSVLSILSIEDFHFTKIMSRYLTELLLRRRAFSSQTDSKELSSKGGRCQNPCLVYSLSPGVWQSFVTIKSCNHLMRIISTYVDNTKKSEIS